MPSEKELLTVQEGHVVTTSGSEKARLDKGADRFLTAGDRIEVARRSVASLTYRGGGKAVLCPTTDVAVGRVAAERSDATVSPYGALDLARGTLLADTTHETTAIRPLQLTVAVGQDEIVSVGATAFAARSAAQPVTVALGTVRLNGDVEPVAGGPVACRGGLDRLGVAGTAAGPAPTPVVVPTAAPTPTSTPTPAVTTPAVTTVVARNEPGRKEDSMTCWFCAKAARATCRFCERGLCEDHAKFGPYLLEVHRSESRGRSEGLVVEDAVQCGTCRPRPQPVPMPELD